MTATPQQVREWSDQVAADPRSRAFLPLAEHYREAGRADAAVRLVLRGLERHPHDVEAHYLLGCLYRDGGDPVRAFDEWDFALALAPEHRGARREIGLLCHARGDWTAAVRHLERAREDDVMDDEVRRALDQAWARSRGGAPAGPGASRRPAPVTAAAPPASPAAPPPVGITVGEGPDGVTVGEGPDGFDALHAELRRLAAARGMVGAVMLDAQGYVLAGAMQVAGRDRGPEIAAVLSPASSEAERTLKYLGLGGWQGILVETPQHVVRLSPSGDGGMVAVAGRRDVPTGWVLRVAARAAEAARRFLEMPGGGR
ncbi:MAG TPA: tetratricopeptide repeat protein [Longimicrobiaceae bacterium]|nr:tetratricopeptide repeat protein [Longimicrobiaceae bacterium]